MRVLLLILAVLATGVAFDAPEAAAQPTPTLVPAPAPGQPGRPPVVQLPRRDAAPATAPAPAPAVAKKTTFRQDPHGDRIESDGKGMALLFWLFALITIGGSIFVVTRRNLIAAVMGMVGSFMGIAAVYMMLYANFLAVVQMLVYAGAIMVLFIFVVMILNRPEDEPVAPSGRVGQAIGAAAMVYLVYRLVMILIHVKAPPGSSSAPAPLEVPGTTIKHAWGSVKAVGTDLFGPGIFPFEAISILLLVAVVGAIAIARHDDPGQQTSDDVTGGAP